MNKRTISLFSILFIAVFVGIFLVSCGSGTAAPSTAGGTDGASLMQERCSVCHSLDRVTSAHKTTAEWTTTVERMISHGAQLDSQEQQTLVEYLAANYK
jgi:competence protein ComEA